MVRPRPGSGPVHLMVDSTGLKLCSSSEWLLEKHGTKTRRDWRKLHIAVDADTGEIATPALTSSDVDDASQVGILLDQVDGTVALFTADGAYDQDSVHGNVAARNPEASVIVPPRSSAVPSDTAETTPTMRKWHLQIIAERGRMIWQKALGYHWRALVEADISRFQRVIGDGLRSLTDWRRATEVAITVSAEPDAQAWAPGLRRPRVTANQKRRAACTNATGRFVQHSPKLSLNISRSALTVKR